MSVRGGLLRENEDYRGYIIDYLRDNNGYQIRPTHFYDPGNAMDPDLLFEFLCSTQPETMEYLDKIYNGKTRETIINSINQEVNSKRRNLLDVLKNGVYLEGRHITLMYRQPASTINAEARRLYDANILSVMTEVHHKSDESIDMVIFINGIAIAAFELKCNTSGQDIADAVTQWKNARDPGTRLTRFKIGCLVFFAMDLNEVQMCTHLQGEKSFFLPFNRGSGTGIDTGKGNPHNENGINVSYMWEDILTKDTLIYLIEKILFIERKEERNPNTGKKRVKEALIFPRFHQLRALRRVTTDITKNGTARNYLINHSAGSGKTNTIAWMAHRLASLHDSDNNAVIDKVIIATDRIVVDRQLQDAVRALETKPGLVVVMDESCTSSDLSEAIAGSCKIIVTTLHKFMYIRGEVSNTCDKHFAFIIDEAHSSTAGTIMESARYVMSEGDLSQNEGNDYDRILDDMNRVGKQDNITTIAFTATPKPMTMQLFGTRGSDGQIHEFDLYSMKQAIEEGFILDVLQNYITYQTYYKLNKTIEDDPELESRRAKRKIAKYIELHETNIAQKVEIIVEHFRTKVKDQLGGRAKAMVVTSSREAAVRYTLALNEYVKHKGYDDIHALVAFTDSIDVDGKSYTEKDMNGFNPDSLPEVFDGDTYKVLIVADKYQTGFDQPKLCAMYVDKKLKGVNAVQTLSRLNRICPPFDKKTFVLDFRNSEKDIVDAFSQFYSGTTLINTVSPSDLLIIEKDLDAFGVLRYDEINEFNEELVKDKLDRDVARMWSLLDSARMRYCLLSDDEKDDFRFHVKSFVRYCCFLMQATTYQDVDQFKKYNYLTYLVKELDVGGVGIDFDIADKISADNFKQEKVGELSIEVKPSPSMTVNPPRLPGEDELIFKRLSEIINDINVRYNKHYDPEQVASIVGQLCAIMRGSDVLRQSARANTVEDFGYAYDDEVEEALKSGYDTTNDFYRFMLQNRDARQEIMGVLKEGLYAELRMKGEEGIDI